MVENLGDTVKNRKAYCSSMLKLVERGFYENNLYLKLNPNLIRMEIIKIWKKTLLGLISFILAFTLSLPVFAIVTDLSQDRVDTQGEVVNNIEVNNGERVEIISDEDYEKLELGKISRKKSNLAKVNERIKLGSFEKTSYEFELNDDKNEAFIINLKDMSCSGGIKYQVIVEEDGKIIYNKYYSSDSILKVKANRRSNYIVTIVNRSNKTLSGKVKINSYVR